jgi:hypothetical protein
MLKFKKWFRNIFNRYVEIKSKRHWRLSLQEVLLCKLLFLYFQPDTHVHLISPDDLETSNLREQAMTDIRFSRVQQQRAFTHIITADS